MAPTLVQAALATTIAALLIPAPTLSALSALSAPSASDPDPSHCRAGLEMRSDPPGRLVEPLNWNLYHCNIGLVEGATPFGVSTSPCFLASEGKWTPVIRSVLPNAPVRLRINFGGSELLPRAGTDWLAPLPHVAGSVEFITWEGDFDSNPVEWSEFLQPYFPAVSFWTDALGDWNTNGAFFIQPTRVPWTHDLAVQLSNQTAPAAGLSGTAYHLAFYASVFPPVGGPHAQEAWARWAAKPDSLGASCV